jgi:hypothetical protein
MLIKEAAADGALPPRVYYILDVNKQIRDLTARMTSTGLRSIVLAFF